MSLITPRSGRLARSGRCAWLRFPREVIAAAPAGADCDVPAILLTRCPDTPRPAEFPGESSLRQFAEALAQSTESA